MARVKRAHWWCNQKINPLIGIPSTDRLIVRNYFGGLLDYCHYDRPCPSFVSAIKINSLVANQREPIEYVCVLLWINADSIVFHQLTRKPMEFVCVQGSPWHCIVVLLHLMQNTKQNVIQRHIRRAITVCRIIWLSSSKAHCTIF